MGERGLELADLRASQEREASLAATRAAIGRTGREDCVDCEMPIPADRLAVAPFALRCVPCQQAYEHEGLRR